MKSTHHFLAQTVTGGLHGLYALSTLCFTICSSALLMFLLTGNSIPFDKPMVSIYTESATLMEQISPDPKSGYSAIQMTS